MNAVRITPEARRRADRRRCQLIRRAGRTPCQVCRRRPASRRLTAVEQQSGRVVDDVLLCVTCAGIAMDELARCGDGRPEEKV